MTQLQNTHYDALIIGQGLAGSLLAWEMIQQGQKVLVIDKKHEHSSSMVAAGIINPITGHRINLTYDFPDFMSVAKDTYQSLSDSLNCSFFSAISQQRLIKNKGQHDYYVRRLQQAEYQNFLKPLSKNSSVLRSADHGIAHIQQSYRVETRVLLNKIKTWLLARNALLEHTLDYEELIIQSNEVRFDCYDKSLSANCIIFCEGFQAVHNPWLKDLPFKLAKGEILTIDITEKEPKEKSFEGKCTSMLNWGHWLLPIASSGKKAFLGASYEWNKTELNTDQNIANELMQSMKKNTNLRGEIIDHKAGIRPTTINRKPFIGAHPKHANLYCFNGFGSKGCLIIPRYAKLFAQHFSQETPMPSLFPELDGSLPIDS